MVVERSVRDVAVSDKSLVASLILVVSSRGLGNCVKIYGCFLGERIIGEIAVGATRIRD